MRGARGIRERHGLPELGELGPELAHVARWQVVVSLAVPWACVGIYASAAWLGWWPVAVLSVVLLSFFTYGSVSHDLVHGNLGLSRWVNDVLLCVTELLAVRSGHAYQAAHLHHHARFPAEDDIEGAASGYGFVRSLAEGLVLQPRLWVWAVRRGGRKREWIVFEGVTCMAIVAVAVALMPWTVAPAGYLGLVIAGSWIIPLVTSYVPHDAHAAEPIEQTRLFRGWVLSLVAVEHLYHLEHHLYPRVPHHHWAALAKRLDPYFERAGVREIRPSGFAGAQDRREGQGVPEG